MCWIMHVKDYIFINKSKHTIVSAATKQLSKCTNTRAIHPFGWIGRFIHEIKLQKIIQHSLGTLPCSVTAYRLN